MRNLLFFSLLLSSLLLAACKPTKNMEKASLPGTSWQLKSWKNGSGQMMPLAPEKATLTFEAGNKLGGNSGCNAFGGDYTLEGDRLMGNPFSTKRYCEEAAEQENAIFTALRQGAAVAQTKELLSLTARAGTFFYEPLQETKDTGSAAVTDPMTKPASAKRYKGLFTYFADAAVFKDCEDGQLYSVEIGGGAYLACEKAYSRYGKSGGEAAYMVVDASMVKNPEPEGRPYLMRIEKLVSGSADSQCPE